MTLSKVKNGYQILRNGQAINNGQTYTKEDAMKLKEIIEAFGWG